MLRIPMNAEKSQKNAWLTTRMYRIGTLPLGSRTAAPTANADVVLSDPRRAAQSDIGGDGGTPQLGTTETVATVLLQVPH